MAYLSLGIVLAYFVMCYLLARSYSYPSKVVAETPPEFSSEIWITASGREVPIWAALPKDPVKSVVFLLVHGYGGNRATWTSLAQELKNQGYPCFVPAMPGHDSSEEDATSFGVGESALLVEVAGEIRKRYSDCGIVGVGLSMGGSALLLASDKEPTALDGIAADSSFADFSLAISGYFDATLPCGRLLLAPTTFFASRIAGIDPQSVRPVESAGAWAGRPFAVLQGTRDRIMGRKHAELLSRAAGVETTWFEGAGHADCFDSDPEKYLDCLKGLARQVEKPTHAKPDPVK